MDPFEHEMLSRVYAWIKFWDYYHILIEFMVNLY